MEGGGGSRGRGRERGGKERRREGREEGEGRGEEEEKEKNEEGERGMRRRRKGERESVRECPKRRGKHTCTTQSPSLAPPLITPSSTELRPCQVTLQRVLAIRTTGLSNLYTRTQLTYYSAAKKC